MSCRARALVALLHSGEKTSVNVAMQVPEHAYKGFVPLISSSALALTARRVHCRQHPERVVGDDLVDPARGERREFCGPAGWKRRRMGEGAGVASILRRQQKDRRAGGRADGRTGGLQALP